MKRILLYLFVSEDEPRSGNRPQWWISNDTSRHYKEIITEAFGENITDTNRSRITASLKRLSNYGLIEERGGRSFGGGWGHHIRYWKLTDEGKKIAHNYKN